MQVLIGTDGMLTVLAGRVEERGGRGMQGGRFGVLYVVVASWKVRGREEGNWWEWRLWVCSKGRYGRVT